jgi:Fur family ferric uptake transcriptional regulator
MSDLVESTHREIAVMLARAGNRYTAGRRRLVEVLAGAGKPVTLPDVLDAEPALSQSSVYRNLDVLERSGVITRLATGAEFAHFELSETLLGHHHHLICVACGAVTDVELSDRVERLVDAALDEVAREAGFDPLGHSLDLHGHCADCH